MHLAPFCSPILPPYASGAGKIYLDNGPITAARKSILAYARCLGGLRELNLAERHLDISEGSIFDHLRRAVVWTVETPQTILSEDNLRKLDAYIQRPTNVIGSMGRTESIKLSSPLVFDGYPFPFTRLDLKGCRLYHEEFAMKEPALVPHLGSGFSTPRMSPDPVGNMVTSSPSSSPEGGLLFREALLEFFNTLFLSAFMEPENLFLVKYPLALGLYPDLSYLGLHVGFIIFGTPEALTSRGSKDWKSLPTAVARTLAWCHNHGVLHPWLHKNNLTITPDGRVGVHDLGGSWNLLYHKITHSQFDAGRLEDFRYASNKSLKGILPLSLFASISSIDDGGFFSQPLKEMLEAYRGEFTPSSFERLLENRPHATREPYSFFRPSMPTVPEALVLEAIDRIDQSGNHHCPFERDYNPREVIAWFFSLCGYKDIFSGCQDFREAPFFKEHPARRKAAEQVVRWFLRCDSPLD